MKHYFIALTHQSYGGASTMFADAYYPVTLNSEIPDFLVANAALDVFELYIPTELYEHASTRVFQQQDTGAMRELNVDLELSYSFSAKDCFVGPKTNSTQTARLNALIEAESYTEIKSIKGAANEV